MKYPTKLSDAVHILAFIALHPNCGLTSEKIAESIQTNAGYVRQLMSALRRGGLLLSVKGHPRPSLAKRPVKLHCWMCTRLWRATNPCFIRILTPIQPAAWA